MTIETLPGTEPGAPPPPRRRGIRGWIGRHKLRTALLGIAVVVIASIAANSGSPSAPSTGYSALPAQSQPPPNKALAYLGKVRGDMDSVSNGMTTVMTALGLVLLHPSDQSQVQTLSDVTEQLHSALPGIKDDIVTHDGPGSLHTAAVNLFAGADDLHGALGTLEQLISTNDPVVASKFKEQYANAAGEWNSGVQAIFAAAGQRVTDTLPPLN